LHHNTPPGFAQRFPLRGAGLPTSPFELPREVIVAPRHSGWQARVFQSAALPGAFVGAVHMNETSRSIVRSFAQWRLDFPGPRDAGCNAALQSVFAVAEAMLSRGAVPLCGKATELLLVDGFAERSGDWLDGALLGVALAPTIPYEPVEFDSDAERTFMQWAVSETGFPSRGWSVTPHVSLGSLAFPVATSPGARVDFAFVHPTAGVLAVDVRAQRDDATLAGECAWHEALAAVGITAIRVPTSELEAGAGAQLEAVRSRLCPEPRAVPADHAMVLRMAKFAHQVQCALLEALRGGWLVASEPWDVAILLPAALRDDASPRATEVVACAVAEFREVVARLCALHEVDVTIGASSVQFVRGRDRDVAAALLVAPSTALADELRMPAGAGRLLIADTVLAVEVAAPSSSARPLRLKEPVRAHAEWFLDHLFRKGAFREGQWETVRRVLQGKDTVALLPTGAGKSIAFQLSAMLLPGRCLVVDPILSLIDDQLDNLGRVGIDRGVGITSQVTDPAERACLMHSFASGQYLFCYVAPERFQATAFREALRALTAIVPVSLVAIDEAHCVSEWGHDFRTAYLNLGRIAREYGESSGFAPPLVALTGTASRIVLSDVQREIGITDDDALITPRSFDRPELEFVVLRARSGQKARRVEGILRALPSAFGLDRDTFFRPNGAQSHAGLVFCPHVNGDYGVVRQARELRATVGRPVDFYAGGAPKGFRGGRWDDVKRRVARRFKRNDTTVLACTNAFGMGIDKPNIRFTVHTGLPPSIESFYQEAGRAGRDRRRARCVLVVSNDDPRRTSRLLDPNTDIGTVARGVQDAGRAGAGVDDVIRALHFHIHSFRGVDAEVVDGHAVMTLIGDLTTRRTAHVGWRGYAPTSDEESHQRLEKALHRLVVVGAVSDYTVDYAGCTFSLRVSGADQREVADRVACYVGGYQRTLAEPYRARIAKLDGSDHRAFLHQVLRILTGFVYDTVERARRRSLQEMLDAAAACDGEALRARMLSYLQVSPFGEALDAVAQRSRAGGLDEISSLLRGINTVTEAAELRGAVGRYLASYPDVPGLLLLRAVAEALSAKGDREAVRQNTRAAMRFARGAYAVSPRVIAAALAEAAVCAERRVGMGHFLVRVVVGSESMDRETARELAGRLPSAMALIPVQWLAGRLATRTHDLVSSGRHQHDSAIAE
jgi:ATP-dependent DNA helicase RecQ